MGDPPLGPSPSGPLPLVSRDETNADHGAASRTAHRRERGLGLAEGRHESETIGLRNAPLALGAAKLAAIKLGVRRLEVGEANSLLSSHLALPPWPPGPSSSVRYPAPGRCRRSGLRLPERRRRREAQPLAAEWHFGEAADVLEVFALRLVDERVGDASPPGPSGPPHTMDVGIGVLGQVVVHDVTDVIDMDAPCREVRRDERRKRAAAKPLEHTFTLALPDVAVERPRRPAQPVERLDELVRAVLRPTKHERPLDPGSPKELVKCAHLVGLAHLDPGLVDRINGGCLRLHRDEFRVLRVALGDRAHLRGERRREKRRLAGPGKERHDPRDVGREPEIEQAIGFIEDEHADLAQIARPSRHEVQQPAPTAIDVSIVNLHDEAAPDPADEKVVGTIVNAGDKPVSRIAIRVNALDASGQVVRTVTTPPLAQPIGPFGGRATFEATMPRDRAVAGYHAVAVAQ